MKHTKYSSIDLALLDMCWTAKDLEVKHAIGQNASSYSTRIPRMAHWIESLQKYAGLPDNHSAKKKYSPQFMEKLLTVLGINPAYSKPSSTRSTGLRGL